MARQVSFGSQDVSFLGYTDSRTISGTTAHFSLSLHFYPPLTALSLYLTVSLSVRARLRVAAQSSGERASATSGRFQSRRDMREFSGSASRKVDSFFLPASPPLYIPPRSSASICSLCARASLRVCVHPRVLLAQPQFTPCQASVPTHAPTHCVCVYTSASKYLRGS